MSMHTYLNEGTKTEVLSTIIGGIARILANLGFLNIDENILPHTSEYRNNTLCLNMAHWNKVFDNEKKPPSMTKVYILSVLGYTL